MLKSDQIEKKFIWSKKISDFEVETDTGFVDIMSLNKTIPYLKYIIDTEFGKHLECADKHILFTNSMEEVFADELSIGDIIQTKDGPEKIISIICTEEYENMFDLELAENSNHRYYTNNILSHNTLIAKQLAKEMFGDEKALIRFDMSEYPDKTAVNKLIGSNPGYVGYEEGGQLTEAVKNKKYCVLLLDEIEKADPEVYNIFLQVLDEGFLTDNSGQKVDFKNVIVLFTSNAGAKTASDFGKGIGFSHDEEENKKRILIKQLKNKFPPEFLNRLDNIVHFNALKKDDMKAIIRLEIGKLQKKMEEIGYNLVYDEDTVSHILEIVSEEKEYGARPIVRAIRDEIEDKVTDLLLENEYEKGHVFTVSYPYTIDPDSGNVGLTERVIIKMKPIYSTLQVS